MTTMQGTTAQTAAVEAGRWNGIAIAVLPLVAAVGAVLSWGSLYAAATKALGADAPAPFGVNLAGAAFPLLVDALILGASARYVAGVKAARPVGGWRAAAHAGVVGTVLLNAAAAPTLGDVPWHVTAPIVWSVLVELVSRDVLDELREVRTHRADRIPLRLWLTTPAESVRISWRMARTGASDADAARAGTERCAAARDQLAAALPGPRRWRRRRQITRRLWAGVLDPATLARLIDTHPDPAELHRTVLRAIATGAPAQPETAAQADRRTETTGAPAQPETTGAPAQPETTGAPAQPETAAQPDRRTATAEATGAPAQPETAAQPDRRTATAEATGAPAQVGRRSATDAEIAAAIAGAPRPSLRAVGGALRAQGLSVSEDRLRAAMAAAEAGAAVIQLVHDRAEVAS